VIPVTRPYVSIVTTGIRVEDPVVPGVATPLARSITGVTPPVEVTRPVVPLTELTYVPAGCLLLNVFQSVLVRYPLTEVDAAGMLMFGVVPPLDVNGRDVETLVTYVPAGCLLLNVVQSAELNTPRLVAEAVGTFSVITGVVVLFATVELKSVPVVPSVNAATEVTVPPEDGLVLVTVKLGYVPVTLIPVPFVNTTV